MKADFYLCLGVSRQADAESIKRAYRKIAKSCHPDMEGAGGDASRFQELQEAYETLSDTEKRRQYDERLKSKERRTREPNFQREDRFSTDADTFFFDSQAVDFEAILSLREAREGVSCQLPVQVATRCHWCTGPLPHRRFFCSKCGGTGRIQKNCFLPLNIPSGIKNGSVLTLNIQSMPAMRVRVLVNEGLASFMS